MVFGVFDRLHPGHRAFLRQAKQYGRELIAVVARDSSVLKLKNKKPRQSESQRLRALRKATGITKAVLGDQKQSSYAVIKKYKPDVMCLGYDQKWLARDLRKEMRTGNIPFAKIIRLKAYRPHIYHSSLRGVAA